MFTDLEKEKIKEEFAYNDVKKQYKNNDTDVSCDFTEHHLETIDNDDLRNLTTKSIILAPFNSTTSCLGTEEEIDINEMRIDRKAIRYNAKCRDFNRQYEMNNNCELDNGVYNKFMQSSRASLHFSPSQKEDGHSDGLSGGDSLQLSFKKKEKQLEDADEQGLDNQVEEEIRLEQDKREKGEFSEFERVTQEVEDGLFDKEDIDMFIVEEIAEFGYPKEFIVETIESNAINYATASYYLLKKRCLIDNSHPLMTSRQEVKFEDLR